MKIETPLFVITRTAKEPAAARGRHEHPDAQLTFAAAGTVQIHTDDGVHLVPPQLAAWVPPGVPHRLELLTEAELWMVYWRPSAVAEWIPKQLLERAFTLCMSPLLRALFDACAVEKDDAERIELIARLMLHELTALPEAPTFLPLPVSAAGRRAADLALRDHRNALTIEDLATRSATSVRTLSRLFPAETGLTFKAWRQRARIVGAMERLARGRGIAATAAEVGFASTAAFSCAFRQVTAMTPTAFLAQSDRIEA